MALPSIHLNLEGDGKWQDLIDQKIPFIDAMDSSEIDVSVLPHGTAGGRPTVAFRVKAPSGETMVFQTTLRLFQTVAKAIEAAYGDEISKGY